MADDKIIYPFTDLPGVDDNAPVMANAASIQAGNSSTPVGLPGTFSSLQVGSGSVAFYVNREGMWLGGASFATAPFRVSMAGVITADSLTLTGGTFKYGKTDFTDATHAGYYIGAEGVYFGAAADATKFKFDIATGAMDYIGTLSGRSTITLAAAIDAAGHFADAAISTATGTILGAFTFGASGAIQIGTYQAGVTGDIRISPTGILGRDKDNNMTFSINAMTGVAVVSGLVVGTNVGIGTAQTAANVTTIVGNTVTTGFVNALGITAVSVAAENITGTTISGKTITGGYITGVMFNQYFGDGSGGNITWATNASLSADIYADNLTINNGVTIYTNGWRIFVRNTLTNNGVLDCSAVDNATAGSVGLHWTNAGDIVIAGGTGATGGGAAGSYYGKAPNGQAGGLCEYSIDGYPPDSHYGVSFPGVAGTSVNPSLGVSGAAGGTGGNSSNSTYGPGVGGAGGTATSEQSMISNDWTIVSGNINSIYSRELIVVQGVSSHRILSFSAGSGGGGAGEIEITTYVFLGGSGGGAGAPGGIIYIAARTLINNGTISSNGSRGREGGGGASGGGVNSGGGGGGGGGAGGLIFLVYQNITQSGSLTVNGGAAGGTSSQGGVAGTAGTNGYVNQYHIIP